MRSAEAQKPKRALLIHGIETREKNDTQKAQFEPAPDESTLLKVASIKQFHSDQ